MIVDPCPDNCTFDWVAFHRDLDYALAHMAALDERTQERDFERGLCQRLERRLDAYSKIIFLNEPTAKLLALENTDPVLMPTTITFEAIMAENARLAARVTELEGERDVLKSEIREMTLDRKAIELGDSFDSHESGEEG